MVCANYGEQPIPFNHVKGDSNIWFQIESRIFKVKHLKSKIGFHFCQGSLAFDKNTREYAAVTPVCVFWSLNLINYSITVSGRKIAFKRSKLVILQQCCQTEYVIYAGIDLRLICRTLLPYFHLIMLSSAREVINRFCVAAQGYNNMVMKHWPDDGYEK